MSNSKTAHLSPPPTTTSLRNSRVAKVKNIAKMPRLPLYVNQEEMKKIIMNETAMVFVARMLARSDTLRDFTRGAIRIIFQRLVHSSTRSNTK